MSWISGLVGGIAAGAGVRGANMSTDRNNRFWSPETINANAAGMNPWVWNAMRGIQGNGNQFSQDMYNIAQGKDISPYLLNQPLNQVNRGADTNMARMTAQLGRSNMSGGLGNAYALSNQMGRQNSTANLFQNYGQWRETQRRSDLNWLMGLMQNSQAQGMDLANKHVFKKNFFEKLGAFGQGFVGGMGGGGMGGGQKQNSTQGGQGSTGYSPYVQSLGSSGGWGAASGGGSGVTGVQASNTGWGYNPSNSTGGWNTMQTGSNDPRIQMGSGRIY